MNRLNPFHKEDTMSISFFPPDKVSYKDIQGDNFTQFLLSNATTYKGQHTIARYYDVYEEWIASEHRIDKIDKYYGLLLLVKTQSKKDNIWISFVEGLHRHAATIPCLLCMKFDYDNNIINPGLLDLATSKTQTFHIVKTLDTVQDNACCQSSMGN